MSLQEFIEKFRYILEKKGPKLCIVMPESAGDVFLCTALLRCMRETYPEYIIYFATRHQYQDILKGNPYIDFVIDYCPEMDDIFLMEGVSTFRGFFDICFMPHFSTQRCVAYVHNGMDRLVIQTKY